MTRIRGTVALHASKSMTTHQYIDTCETIQVTTAMQGKTITIPPYHQVVRGAIVGLVDIVNCVRYQEKYKAIEPWFFGEWGFFLSNPRVLPEPIPCKGALGFWEVPVEVVKEIEAQIQMEVNNGRI